VALPEKVALASRVNLVVPPVAKIKVSFESSSI